LDYTSNQPGKLSAFILLQIVGPAKSLAVGAGDTLKMDVYAKYPDNSGSYSTVVGGILSAVTSAFNLAGGENHQALEAFESLFVSTKAGMFHGGSPLGEPAAYLQFIFFDDDYEFVDAGYIQVTDDSEGDYHLMQRQYVVPEPGFIYIYVANETEGSVNVFFDDMMITHIESPVVQHDDYYPFGLTFNSYTSGTENLYKFSGYEEQKETQWYDFGARMYDPALGRFFTIDPLADHPKQIGMSPYSAFWNNPIRYNDPDGRCPECEENVIDPTDGQSYTSTGGAEYIFGNGEWTRQGGTLDEVVVTASRNEGSALGGKSPSLGDFGTGLSLAGEGMWLLGENRSTSLYQQGFRRGLSGNYQLTGRNLSLFGNQTMTSATKPISRLAPIGKTLSGGGTALSVVSLGFDVADYSSGNLDGSRLGYRATGTGASIGAAYFLGGPYGAAVGGLFFLGEKAWDMTQPMRDEISRQYWQFENALRSGWRPR